MESSVGMNCVDECSISNYVFPKCVMTEVSAGLERPDRWARPCTITQNSKKMTASVLIERTSGFAQPTTNGKYHEEGKNSTEVPPS